MQVQNREYIVLVLSFQFRSLPVCLSPLLEANYNPALLMSEEAEAIGLAVA